jgi:hypothetical protein
MKRMDLNPTDDWSNVDKQELQEFFFWEIQYTLNFYTIRIYVRLHGY